MVWAIGFGIWTMVSIIVTPLVGYFLFALSRHGQRPKRFAENNRFRPASWNYLASRRTENFWRAGVTKSYRREVKRPRTG
jgi:hypothetical protein